MKNTRLILVVALVLIILASGIAGFVLSRATKGSQPSKSNNNQQNTSVANQAQGISLDEVAKHTGRDGNSCWVAVDDTVYEISGFVLWVEGEHKPSGGRAKCGKDLSEVIKQSPHGKSKLKLLKEIGPLQQ